MEFLKRNWAKLLLAAISLTGAVLMLIPIFQSTEFKFFGLSQLLGPAIFFLGLTAYTVMSMFYEKREHSKLELYNKIVLLATALLSTALMLLGLLGFRSGASAEGGLGSAYAMYNGLKATSENARAAANAILYSYITMLLAFGLIPLIRACKKLFCRNGEDK